MKKFIYLVPVWILFGTPRLHRLIAANVEASGVAHGSEAAGWAWGLVIVSGFYLLMIAMFRTLK